MSMDMCVRLAGLLLIAVGGVEDLVWAGHGELSSELAGDGPWKPTRACFEGEYKRMPFQKLDRRGLWL